MATGFHLRTLEQYQQGGGPQVRAFTLPLSLAAHITVIGGLVLFTLVRSETLPDPTNSAIRAFFVEPAAPPPPPPPPPKAAAVVTKANPATAAPTVFTAPVAVPDRVEADAGSDLGVSGGVPEGVDGGVPGGVAGGIVGGLPDVPAPPSPTVVRIGGDVREPRKLKQVNPEYPPVARAAHIEGIVVLECLIDADGHVKNVQVLRAPPVLADAAVEAVRQWVYAPTLVNGIPSQALMTVTVRFELHSGVARVG
jgi:periplasmic protein TonB